MTLYIWRRKKWLERSKILVKNQAPIWNLKKALTIFVISKLEALMMFELILFWQWDGSFFKALWCTQLIVEEAKMAEILHSNFWKTDIFFEKGGQKFEILLKVYT